MKSFMRLITILFLATLSLSAQIAKNPQKVLENSQSNFFIENKGQWDSQILYLSRIEGMNVWITNSGVVYDYFKVENDNKQGQNTDLPFRGKEDERNNIRISGHVIRMDFVGANTNPQYSGIDKKEAYYNYFTGNDQSKWASFISLYSEAEVDGIYDGIGLRYYFDKGSLRYDFRVDPGADPSRIQINLEGEDEVRVRDNGELVIKTTLGEVTHGKLYAYQKTGDSKVEVSCRFELTTGGKIGIRADNYDKNKELIIDPLVYSTFLGGSGSDLGYSIFLDYEGNAFVTGYTTSANFPTTTGAYSQTPDGLDVFITKLNSSGNTLIYSTFLGGENNEFGYSLAVDIAGNVYVTGETGSYDFPTTSGSYDRWYNGSSDIFITKLNSTGSALIYSTFLGSLSFEAGNSLAVDMAGNVYVTGGAGDSGFPTTAGSYDRSYNGGDDIFITKLNSAGSALVYSTFLGGNDSDIGYSLALDPQGNVFVTGLTTSANFPTTPGAYDRSYDYWNDAFTIKLNSTGSDLIYSTFLGSGESEFGRSIAIDSLGNAYVTGSTNSPNFPTTAGAYDQSLSGGSDVFITKLNSSGSDLVYSTYMGGISTDISNSCAVDSRGNIYITGRTFSNNFPTTEGAHDRSYNDYVDAFTAKLNSNGNGLLYSTYLGGSGEDNANNLALDGQGDVYITGTTSSTYFPTTEGAYDQSFNGSQDVFITKINIPDIALTLLSPNGGEVWQGNTFHNITWLEEYSPADLVIEFSTEGETNRDSLALVPVNTLNFTWEVPSLNVSNARIIIYPLGFPESALISNPITITTNSCPGVTLTSQNNSGINYRAGTLQNINWQINGSVSLVNIDYTTDKGISWLPVASNVNSTLQSYNWTVPPTHSNSCKIRITDANSPLVYDFSDAFFSITAKEILLTSFNNFVRCKAGTQHTITWNSGGISNLRLRCSTTGGYSWSTIVTLGASNSSYVWTIPDAASINCLVRIEDASDYSCYSQSAEPFEIWKPISVTKTTIVGQNSIFFDRTIVILDLFVNTADSITTVYYVYESPAAGTLPPGITKTALFYWKISSPGLSFVNGKISARISSISGVSDPTKLRWLKRANPGDAWENIGGQKVSNNLISTVMFDSLSEFTIGSTDNSNILPVELVSFTATVKNNKVQLKWETASELNNYGFEIERTTISSTAGEGGALGGWEKIGFVKGAGNSTQSNYYVFSDEIKEFGNVFYRLKQIDFAAGYSYSNEIEVKAGLPEEFTLSQNYPNPFNPATLISYQLAVNSYVKIMVYDITGGILEVLVNEQMPAGYYEVEFNAGKYASGIYLYRIEAIDEAGILRFMDMKKMMLVK